MNEMECSVCVPCHWSCNYKIKLCPKCNNQLDYATHISMEIDKEDFYNLTSMERLDLDTLCGFDKTPIWKVIDEN